MEDVMTQRITKDMTFNHILQYFPQVADVLHQFNLECEGCLGAMTESIADGARAHALNIDELVTALNEALDA
jgi:hybrid cluster-associated redox disulfide protein